MSVEYVSVKIMYSYNKMYSTLLPIGRFHVACFIIFIWLTTNSVRLFRNFLSEQFCSDLNDVVEETVLTFFNIVQRSIVLFLFIFASVLRRILRLHGWTGTIFFTLHLIRLKLQGARYTEYQSLIPFKIPGAINERTGSWPRNAHLNFKKY